MQGLEAHWVLSRANYGTLLGEVRIRDGPSRERVMLLCQGANDVLTNSALREPEKKIDSQTYEDHSPRAPFVFLPR